MLFLLVRTRVPRPQPLWADAPGSCPWLVRPPKPLLPSSKAAQIQLLNRAQLLQVLQLLPYTKWASVNAAEGLTQGAPQQVMELAALKILQTKMNLSLPVTDPERLMAGPLHGA